MKIKARTLAILAVLGIAGAAGFVYFGIYNIAATAQHTGPVYLLLEYAMRKSVKARTESIQVPDLTGRLRMDNGLDLYRAHCLKCHGGPGIAPESFSLGMTPAPVNLVGTARHWSPAEIYWVIKHGIKMSGMPAWEYRLSDEEMWDIVAFVERMKTLSPEEYERWSRQVPRLHDARPDSAAMTRVREGVTLGDAKAGERALQQYLCVTCHQIPGIVGANRHVGPPLNGIAHRKYIAGVLTNSPENMVRWLRNPKEVDSLSAMPDLGVTEKDARDMAAYLYTLEDLD